MNLCQRELREAGQALDEFKAAMREKNRELQKCEQDKKGFEKQNMMCLIKIKDLEHNLAKIQKDHQDAVHKVSLCHNYAS